MVRLQVVCRFLAVWAACWASVFAHGQGFPSRAVTIIVPWPAGGAADLAARSLGKALEPLLGQRVIVENVPGAGGSLGVAKALRAPADGYTLLSTTPLDAILAPLNFPAATYKPEDLLAIAMVAHTDFMLVTRPDLGVNRLDELVALAKTQPDKPLSFCSTGHGSLAHLLGARMNALADVKTLAVPYTGLPDCVRDVVGGRVDMAYLPLAGPVSSLIDLGALKALAVLSDAANRRFPKVPPLRATPGFDGFAVALWAGIHVSAKVPEEIAQRLNQAIAAATTKPDFREAVESGGATVAEAMDLAQVQERYRREVKLFQAMVRSVLPP